MDWSKLTVCIVTGSTGPVGQAISKAVASKMSKGSKLILASRNLDRVTSMMKSLPVANGVEIKPLTWDLSQPSVELFKPDLMNARGSTLYTNAVVIHNAAQLGDVGLRVKQMTDVPMLQDQVNMNLFSFLCLNSAFLDVFKDATEKIIVNMTASSATNPKPCFGMTSMVKSGRQLLLNIMALEEKDVKPIQFNPIAVDTEALRDLRDKSHDQSIRDLVKGLYEQGKVLDADRVGRALVNVISSNKYEAGTIIDALTAEKLQ